MFIYFSKVFVAFSSCVLLFGSKVHSLYERDLDIGALPIARNLSVFRGSEADAFLGNLMAPLGDFNGDGIDDIIISSSILLWTTGNEIRLGAYVVFGSNNPPSEPVDMADFVSDNSVGFKIVAPLGWAASSLDGGLAGGGDHNNDGFADILFSITNSRPAGALLLSKGVVYVIYGHSATTRPFVELQLSTFVTGSKGFRIIGAATYDRFGASMANAGDFNSDGFDDIIACAPFADLTGPTRSNVGICYMIFGKPNGQRTADVNLATFSFTATTGFRITGASVNYMLGNSAAGALDFNNDGRSDVAIGDEHGTYVLFGRGSAYAYASYTIDTFASNTSAGVYIWDSGADYGWGMGLASLGDVNGDGIDDILVTAPSAPKTLVAVVYGSATAGTSDFDMAALYTASPLGFMINPGSMFDTLSGAAVGDVNGDGFDDVLVSLESAIAHGRAQAGYVYVIYGQNRTTSREPIVLQNGTNGFVSSPTSGVRIFGAEEAAYLGYPLSPAGDFNHDGTPDLILVASADSIFAGDRDNAGQVYVLSLNLTAPPQALPYDVDIDTLAEGPTFHKVLGEQLHGMAASAAGDFNGDGVDDLFVASMIYDSAVSNAVGGAYLLFGSAAAPTAPLDLKTFTASNTAGFRIFGPSVALPGPSVVGGDYNNDGFADVMFVDTAFGGTGAVFVIYGHNASTTPFADLHLDTFSTGPLGFRILGAAAGDMLGGYANPVITSRSMSNAGDFNSDGFDDIVVCASEASASPEAANSGVCYVIFGQPTSARTIDVDLATFSFTATTGFTIKGSVEFGYFGLSVRGGFDFNHDGHDDILFGDPHDLYLGGGQGGGAFVLYGRGSSHTYSSFDIENFVSDGVFGSTMLGAGLPLWGINVDSLGDVNGDGIDDVLLTPYVSLVAVVVFGSETPQASYDASEFASPSTKGFMILFNSTAGSELGMLVAPAGDANGDGINDILVSSRYESPLSREYAGIVYVIFGKTHAGAAPLVSVGGGFASSPTTGVRILGSVHASNLATSLRAGGDFNHDGRADLLMVSNIDFDYSDTSRPGASQMYILNLDQVPSVTPTSSPTTKPTSSMTHAPMAAPSEAPSAAPSFSPSAPPSLAPTMDPAVLASVLSSPTYKVRNGFAFAVKSASGKLLAWGEAPHGGALSTPLDSDVAEVVPGRFAFAARKTDGSMLTWGVVEGTSASAIQANSIVANEASFAAVSVDGGAVVAFGSKVNGGNVRDEARCNGYKIPLSSEVSKITASAGAFAALKTDGTVYAWGNTHAGGGTSTLTVPSLVGVSAVIATRSAFAAQLSTGAVVVWGDKYSGGDATPVSSLLSADIVHVIAGRAAFVAFTKSNGLVVWGHPKYGGDVGSAAGQLTSNVKYVAQTFTAMAAVKFDGSVVTWGKSDCGGDSSAVQSKLNNTVKVVGNGRAFAALNSTGGVVAWGKPSDGGTIPADKAAHLASGVVSIHHTDRAFAALRSDGRVVVWGQAGHGGSPGGAVEGELASGVHTVCANDAAFSAIKFDGNVVGWGHAVSIPTNGVLFNSGFLTSATCA